MPLFVHVITFVITFKGKKIQINIFSNFLKFEGKRRNENGGKPITFVRLRQWLIVFESHLLCQLNTI